MGIHEGDDLSDKVLNQVRDAARLEQYLTGIEVLLIENKPDIADLLQQVLVAAGAVVITTTTAEDAIAQLGHYRPDIVICNVCLPDRPGEWFIRQVRAHEIVDLRRIPAIAVAADTREVSAEKLMEAGFELYLSEFDVLLDFVAIVFNLAFRAESTQRHL